MSQDKHLGSRLSAVVDGEVGHAERERVYAHLARCAGCRELVEAERAVKARLAGMAAPETPESLLLRLRGLPAPERGAGRASTPVVAARPETPRRQPRPADGRPRSRPTPLRGLRPHGASRLRRSAAGASLVMAAALTTAFVVGGEQGAGTVRPAVEKFGVEHASVTGGVPLVDPATFVNPASLVGAGTP